MVFYRPYFIFFSYTMKKYIVELLGAFFLVLVIALTGDPIAIGVVLMVMVYAGGHISGAHYNPAVTFGLWLRGKI
jgi:aquaporin Z